jgi:hypothetical protein
MKRRNGLILLLGFITLWVISLNCRKEPESSPESSPKKTADYIKKYTGEFTFTSFHRWQAWGRDTVYGPQTYHGEISVCDSVIKNAYRRLKISWIDTLQGPDGPIVLKIAIYPEIYSDGAFVPEGDIHKSLNGRFINEDKVVFNRHQQSVGFTSDADYEGIRK